MTVNYLYDSLDRVTEVHYPAQYGLSGSPRKVVENSYDSASRLSEMKYDGAKQASDIVYNASDQTTSVKIGVTGANQVTENYTFDPQTGLLTNQTAVKGSTTLLDLSYDYNKNGSGGGLSGKTGALTKIVNNLDTNKNREYEYDALGRLTKAMGGATGTLWQQTYTYDRYGNRTNVAATGTAADSSPIPLDGIPNLSYDNTTNRITTTGYEYDAAGNQTRSLSADGVHWLLYEYDAANRLQVVKEDGTTPTTIQGFSYGSTNAKLIENNYTAGGVKIFASVGGTALAEYTEYTATVPTWTKSYTYLGSRILASIEPNGSGGEYLEFNHPDRLSTRLITNSSGSYEQTHLPFGTALNAESTGSTANRFTSYDRSTPTGLDYALNRTYDSKQGRFTQIDPIDTKAVDFNNPQSLNLYVYCGNDPINRTDPNGLFWGFFKKLFKWIGKVLSAVAHAISTVLSNRWVSLAITILSFVVPAFTLLKTLKLISAIPKIMTWFSKALSVISTIGIIGKSAEVGGALLQGKFGQVLKTLGAAFAGALLGVIEDSIINGALDTLKNGKFSLGGLLHGAWEGFKNGLHYVKSALARFGSKKWWEGFIPIYGFFCAPGYGIGGPTGNEAPSDGLDSACKKHDEELDKFNNGLGKAGDTVTSIDLRLIGRALIAPVKTRLIDIAFGQRFSSGEVYRAVLPVAFGFRIIANGGK